jgi:hypothetical protein
VQARFPDDLLLNQGNFLEGKLHSQIATGHHDGIRGIQNPAQILQGGVLLDLRDQLEAPRNERPQLFHVLGAANEGKRDVVHAERNRLLHVFYILIGQRRGTHLDAGKVHPLVRFEIAAVMDYGLDPLLLYAPYLEREKPVVQQDPGSDAHVLGKVVVGSGDLTGLREMLGSEDDPLSRREPDRLLQAPHPDAGTLQVQENRSCLAPACQGSS